MKKTFLVLILFTAFIGFCFLSMFHGMRWQRGDHNISIRVKETDDLYQLTAYYNKNKTARLQRFMDASLHTNHLFSNSRMDATVTLDDQTSFYIKSYPGRLLIKLDKNVNDEDSYHRIKQLGEEIKHRLADN